MNTPRRLLVTIAAAALLMTTAACAPAVVSHLGAPVPARATHAPRESQQHQATPAPAPSPSSPIDLSRHPVTDPTSPWVVVNKRHPLTPQDVPELTTVRGYLVQPAAAPDLDAMLRAAHDAGVDLTLRSAYRGWEKQKAVYDGWVASLGQAEADRVSARPGHSEHQTGLAVDIGSSTRPDCDFTDCFATTAEGLWVAEHATEYGFVVRYTAENQAATGYEAEAWHLRWVGRDLAAYMAVTGAGSLEEVFGVSGGDYA